jgi:Lon protease-like protein
MDFLPFFPLNITVFEQEELRLHIFEPRYKQMITECMAQSKSFGILTVMDGEVQKMGTEIRVEKLVNKHIGGEMDIVCRGICRFYVEEFHEVYKDKLYPGGLVSFLQFVDDEDKELKLRLSDLLSELYNLTTVLPEQQPEYSGEISRWIHKCGLSLQQEYECLRFHHVSERQQFLINHLKALIESLAEVSRMKAIIQANGHFKKLTGLK